MNAMHIINITGVIFEALLVASVMNLISKKSLKKFVLIPSYILLVLLQSICTQFIKQPLILSSIMLVLIFFVTLLYRMSWLKRIVVSIALVLAFILTEMLIGFIVSFFTKATIEQTQTSIFFYIQCVLGSKVIMLLLIQGFKLFASKGKAKLLYGMYAATIILPIATLLISFAVSEIMYLNNNSRLSLLMIIGIVSIIVANFILIYFAERNIAQIVISAKNQIVASELVQQTKHYKELVENYKIDNKKLHDIDKQFVALKGMIDANVEGVSEGINRVSEIIHSVKNRNRTGIASIDAIIASVESKICSDVEFKNNMFIADLDKMDELDLCMLLGNLIDNAIEECTRIVDLSKAKLISCEIKNIGNYMHIVIENSKRVELEKTRSSKADKFKHGYGLKIIDDIVAKYHGNIVRNITDDVFSTMIMLKSTI